ncbi:MAG: single-stranded DNA-binding protein [Oscillospiraceae bacterium]|jgi:single-strand DNA-binding protein|nr:single-stranded DNA-binding protein [Oscillospiraceae bacterium]
MYNYVALMGRLTHNPQLSKTTEGIPVVSCRIAIDRNQSKKGGNRKTDFVNIVAWNLNAESIAKHLTKNRLITVSAM